jgi:lipoate-protein ligase A
VKDGLIQKIKFFGDYLGYGENEIVEKMLTGVRFDNVHILSVLKTLDLTEYFGDISPEEMTDWLIG